ncbi:MAG: hypothetical protein CL569_16330 [Alphaproteobacteria bacterium]|nr:hypothetical protein [Alphaproteobacteria bacterium]|tara:strand:+ start:833 stop:1762 length:930 start_codon:yes stop_codon:yes gene_type:complete
MGTQLSDSHTQKFYSSHRWPGPEAIVSRKWAVRLRPYIDNGDLQFLDAGCGSGQYSLGMLAEYPAARGVAIDLSTSSLDDLRKSASRAGFEDRLEIECRSFSEPLGWDGRFDVVIANGSIHHSPNLHNSIRNIGRAMKVGGILGSMIYGDRSHARRYEVKEALQLMSGGDIELMHELYKSYEAKFGTWLDRTPRAVIRNAKNWINRRYARLMGKEEALGYDPRADHKKIFIDGYAAPIDVAISSLELREMLEVAGLDLCELLTMARPDSSQLPEGWCETWERLSEWDRIRVCELLTPEPTSFSFIARRL